jgi:hypothetical protein
MGLAGATGDGEISRMVSERAGTVMVEDSRGIRPMIASRHECARGFAGSGKAAALGVADGLCLAAAPTFALMALLAAVHGGGRPDMICSALHGASPLSGMVPMYVLMSAFHAPPWLKLIARRRSRARQR